MSRIEARPVRIRHEMNRPRKEAAFVLVIADMDDADVGQRAGEDRLNLPARGTIDEVERAIDHHP